MKKARLYQTKLVNIRKEMIHLHERVGKLKVSFILCDDEPSIAWQGTFQWKFVGLQFAVVLGL